LRIIAHIYLLAVAANEIIKKQGFSMGFRFNLPLQGLAV
jgi:hypothetical protein